MDAFIDLLVPLLEPGDIIIDGGNSEYQDTQRRVVDLEKKGSHFLVALCACQILLQIQICLES